MIDFSFQADFTPGYPESFFLLIPLEIHVFRWGNLFLRLFCSTPGIFLHIDIDGKAEVLQ